MFIVPVTNILCTVYIYGFHLVTNHLSNVYNQTRTTNIYEIQVHNAPEYIAQNKHLFITSLYDTCFIFFKEKETILQKVKHNFSRDIHTYIFIYYGAYILYDALRGVHNNFAPTHLDLFRKG